MLYFEKQKNPADYQLDDLEEAEQEFLLFALEHFAGQGDLSEAQTEYLASIKADLSNIEERNFNSLSELENLENTATQKFILKIVMTFFYLRDKAHVYNEEQAAFLDLFSVNRKTREALRQAIEEECRESPAAAQEPESALPEIQEEKEPRTPAEILQRLKKIAGEPKDWDCTDKLRACLRVYFWDCLKRNASSMFEDTISQLDTSSPIEKTFTYKSKIRDKIKKEYQEVRASLVPGHTKSFSAAAAQVCSEWLEEKKQEALSFLRILGQKCPISEEIARVESIPPDGWQEKIQELLDEELRRLSNNLKEESHYLARLSFERHATTDENDPFLARVIIGAIATSYYEDNSSEVMQEISEDLQSCASAYASKAGRAYDNFAWRNFAQPLQRLVRELAAKLELPQ